MAKNLGTIQDLVNKEAYGYGVKISKKFGPAVQSIHEFFQKILENFLIMHLQKE